MADSLLSRFDSPFSVLSVSQWVEWLQIEEFLSFGPFSLNTPPSSRSLIWAMLIPNAQVSKSLAT